MKEAAVALTTLPQADGSLKNRPVIALREMPGFGDWLVCGVSTQLRQEVMGFDEIITNGHQDFLSSGLKAPSLIRLGFLAVLPSKKIVGVIGYISTHRHALFLQKLSQHLLPNRTV